MVSLPIDTTLPEIIAHLRECRSLVLVAPPGAGKTTRVPPATLRANLLSPQHPNVIVLQPRRVAARTVAARIAEENNWKLGNEVGYHVRFDRMLGKSTRLRVLTEGILTRQLLDDPYLDGVGAVLLDEFHERSLHTDTSIALLREVQQTVRPDLMLIIMSATLEAEPAAAFLGGCPIIRAEGRTFPIEIFYAPQSQASLVQRVVSAAQEVLSRSPDESGDVLVFLPGADEIRRVQRQLEAEHEDCLILPLHGSLPADEQTRALRPSNQRKVILATNIAQTSLTIDGVRTVIDSGYARVASYDPDRGLDRLDLARISKASATQRAGRSGRTAPGRCIRLWSQKEQNALDDFELPEIKRVDLSGTVLALHAWGKADVRKFGWFEAPDEESLAAAERLLTMLGALDSETNGRITALGRRLVSVPAHPRLARLLLAAAEQGLHREGAALAALISEKDILISTRPDAGAFRGPKTQGTSDLLYRLMLLDERNSPGNVDPIAVRQVQKTRDELLRISKSLNLDTAPRRVRRYADDPDSSREKSGPSVYPFDELRAGLRTRRDERAIASEPSDEDALLRLPLNAYPDRVVKRREKDPAAGVMVGGGGVRLASESTVRQGDLFLAVDARHDPRSFAREALVRVASLVKVEWLSEMFPQSIRIERGVEFDEQRQRVVGFKRTRYRDLLLEEDRHAPVDAEEAGAALAAALRPRASELFAGDESCVALLARVSLLRQHMPEHPWPEFTAQELADALAEQCAERKSVEEISLLAAIRSRLVYPLDRLLDTEAPEEIEVPSGSRIRVQYVPGQPPALAARLQELFGWTQTPRIAAGRVRIQLHLLGPNYRPVQITDDLKNFWATTYFQVRKDLRARYPKHSWPEDPLVAQATSRGGRRRK